MKGGVRGKYVKRYREGTNIVLLEPDVAEAFPNDEAVNQALRGVLNTASTAGIRPRPGLADCGPANPADEFGRTRTRSRPQEHQVVLF